MRPGQRFDTLLRVVAPDEPADVQRGMVAEDVHALLRARVAELGFDRANNDMCLGVAEAWLAAACREVPGFAEWLDERARPR